VALPPHPHLAADREVEFKAVLGRVRIDTRFKLKDMVYRGDLVL
jgi:hypothetical protein